MTASGVQRHTVTSLSKISLIEVRDLCAILWRYRFTVLLLEGKRGRFSRGSAPQPYMPRSGVRVSRDNRGPVSPDGQDRYGRWNRHE